MACTPGASSSRRPLASRASTSSTPNDSSRTTVPAAVRAVKSPGEIELVQHQGVGGGGADGDRIARGEPGEGVRGDVHASVGAEGYAAAGPGGERDRRGLRLEPDRPLARQPGGHLVHLGGGYVAGCPDRDRIPRRGRQAGDREPAVRVRLRGHAFGSPYGGAGDGTPVLAEHGSADAAGLRDGVRQVRRLRLRGRFARGQRAEREGGEEPCAKGGRGELGGGAVCCVTAPTDRHNSSGLSETERRVRAGEQRGPRDGASCTRMQKSVPYA